MESGLFSEERLPPAVRRTVLAGCIGFAVDFFDIYLPTLALAPVIGYFEPPGLSAAASSLSELSCQPEGLAVRNQRA